MTSSTRRICALLGFAALSVLPQIVYSQTTVKWGDVNGDGNVGAVDAQAILTAVVGLSLPSAYNKDNGDANCDAAVAAVDAQIVLSFVVGLKVSQFCVGSAAVPAIYGEVREIVSFGPVAGATVTLTTAGSGAVGHAAGAAARSSVTDAAGRYTFYNNVADGNYSLSVAGATFQQAGATSFAFVGGNPIKADVALTPTTSTGKFGSLGGRVLSSAGTPVSGASVEITGGAQTNGVFKATTTGADGTYAFTGVNLVDAASHPIGSFTVIGRSAASEVGSVGGLTLAANEIHANADIKLQAAPAVSNYFSDGFESGIASWSKSGLWNLRGTTTIKNSAFPAYVLLAPNDASAGAVPGPDTGSGAAWFGSASTGNFIGTQLADDTPLSGGTSQQASQGLLTSPSFTIPATAARATLAFDTWFEIESVNPNANGYDIMEILVTDNSTNATTALVRLNPFEDPSAPDRDAIPFTSGGFNRVPVWRPVYVALDAFKGKSVKIGFCFQTVDQLFNGFRGWLVDNVRVTDETIVGGGPTNDQPGTSVRSDAVGQPARARSPGAIAQAGLVASCSSGVNNAPVASVAVAPATVSLNAGATIQLNATVKDASGNVLTDRPVTWSSANSAIASVSSSGLVTAAGSGGPITITATAEGKSGTAAVTVTSSTTTIVVNAGNNQSASIGTAVAIAPSVKVTNASGNPVLGATVTFSVTSGGGTVVGGTQTTNSSGIATISSWTLGTSVGTNTITATSAGAVGSPLTFTASATSPGMNLTVDGLYLTQSTQSYNGAVPLVAGRSALARVFVKANVTNSVAPSVRLRLYKSGAVVNTYTISATQSSVPTTISEGTIEYSWNVTIPASAVVPGISVLADVDPTGAIVETSKTDNSFPLSGTPLPLDVRTAAPYYVTLIPVLQTPNGLQGDVTESNKATYLDYANRIYPLSSSDAIVHAPYSYSDVLASDYGPTWTTLLNEIEARRKIEGSTRNYYGVIKPSYTSGGTGLGMVDGLSAVGVDWTSAVAGSNTSWRSMTAAHEWGHNFGRNHVDCGGPAEPDVAYPYSTNTIGMYGYDLTLSMLLAPNANRDIMSYCQPLWISDYTYKGVMDYRATHTQSPSPGPVQHSLLIWGRIGADGMVLEPSFEIDAPASLPAKRGPYSVLAVDDAGRELFNLSFEGDPIDHSATNERQFVFVVPLPANGAIPAALRLAANGRQSTRRATSVAFGPGSPSTALASIRMSRAAIAGSRIEWDAATYPMALVRDPVTGEVLSFARGGHINVLSASSQLDVTLSDGVRSIRRRVKSEQQ